MNYFLVLSEINKYFQRVSSLDTKLMASAAACNDNCYNSILQILSEEIIPDYYENNYHNDTKFGRDEIEYEAKQRNYYYDVIEKTNGEVGIAKCEISIRVYGESFVVMTDKWKNFLPCVEVNSYSIDAPEIYIDDMFDMFEELAKIKIALRGLVHIFLSVIGSSVEPEQFSDVLFFKLFVKRTYSRNSFVISTGLLSLIDAFQKSNMDSKELAQWFCQEYDTIEYPIQSPTEIRKRCEEILDDCKRNLKVEQVASKNTAYALVQTAMEGFPRANDIQYTCFSNGTLLLAPYRKTGAILGFVNYSELPRLNDIIRAIATFNDDQVDSLPEGFILLKD